MRVVGVTDDGRPVISSAFRFADTHGLPLGEQMRIAARNGLAVSLYEFVRDALRAGWKPIKIVAYVREEMNFAGQGKDWADAESRIATVVNAGARP